MAARKTIAPELLAQAKRLYEQTLMPVDDIAGMLDLARTSFYKRVREEGWRKRRAGLDSFQLARVLSDGAAVPTTAASSGQTDAQPAPCNDAISPQQRMVLALRIQAVVERQMDALERVIEKITPADQIEAAHGARALASISRTLREIAAINQPEQGLPPNEADDDPIPGDIDEFRFELARRIRGFIEAQRHGAGEVSGEPEASLE